MRDGDRCAEHPTAFTEHEVHLVWCDEFGSADEVALVFTILIVNDDNEFSLAEIFDGIFYLTELK